MLRTLSRAEGLLALGKAAAAARETRILPTHGPHGRSVVRTRSWALLQSHQYMELVRLLERYGHVDDEACFLKGTAERHIGQGGKARQTLESLWWSAPHTAWGLAALRELAAMNGPKRPYGNIARQAVLSLMPNATNRPRDAHARDVDEILKGLRETAPRGGRLIAEIHHATGFRLLQAERFSEAVRALETALAGTSQAPLRRAIELRLGEAQRRRGEYASAMDHFEAVIRSGNDDLCHKALALAGQMAIEYRRYDQAKEWFQAQLVSNPVGPLRRGALWGLGWVAFRTGDFRTARQFFNTLVDETPFDTLAPRALYWSARSLEEMGRRHEARVEYAALARRFPIDYYAYRAAHRLGPRPWPYAEGYLPEPAVPPEVAEVHGATSAGMLRRARRLLVVAARTMTTGLAPQHLLILEQAAEDVGYHGIKRRLERQRWRRFPERSAAAMRSLWREFSSKYVHPLRAEAEAQRVPPELVVALVRQESGFDATAVSPVGALGLMQLMPSTAMSLLAEERRGPHSHDDMLHPLTNIRIGIRYFGRMLRAFGRRPEYALAAYNAGPGAVTRWRETRGDLPADIFVEEIPYAETSRYVKHVLAWLRLYEDLRHATAGTALMAGFLEP